MDETKQSLNPIPYGREGWPCPGAGFRDWCRVAGLCPVVGLRAERGGGRAPATVQSIIEPHDTAMQCTDDDGRRAERGNRGGKAIRGNGGGKAEGWRASTSDGAEHH